MSLGYFVLGFFLILQLPSIYNTAEATLSDDIGVVLSNSCIAMIRANMTGCPTYEEILFLFPDNTDRYFSGDFVYEDGYLQREKPKFDNAYRYYNYDNEKRFWVDPSSRVQENIKLIIIEPRLDEYKIGNQIITNSSVQVGHDRYVDGCKIARISAANWQVLLGDTIHYMGNNCGSEFTGFEEIKTKTWERTLHDITTSYKYQLEQWLKKAIADCGKNYCIPT